MTGIMKKTEVQRLKMVLDQRDSQIEALKRAMKQWEEDYKHELDLRTKAEDEIRALKADRSPAQLHNERIEQMISEDRE